MGSGGTCYGDTAELAEDVETQKKWHNTAKRQQEAYDTEARQHDMPGVFRPRSSRTISGDLTGGESDWKTGVR